MTTDEKDKKLEVSLRGGRSSRRSNLNLPEDCFAAQNAARNDTKKSALRLWLARLLIAVVVAWNLQCAMLFLFNPDAFAPGFELVGLPGEAAVRGFAVLFVMWNVPYLVALWNPRSHRLSLWEALAMQIIGVVGESLVLAFIPVQHSILRSSILRFIIFDAAGIIFLIGAVLIINIRLKAK